MSYKSSDIKVLDEITHVRTNPGMYIGSTETPTHLVEESLDNALDEWFKRHPDKPNISASKYKNAVR